MTGTDQLGFDALLGAADSDNRARKIARETAHLPGTLDDAIPYFRILIRQHHAAMLAADVDEVLRLREQADLLALRPNNGEPGILAGEHAPGCVLARETAAAPGDIPLWGQEGDFIVTAGAMRVRIEMEGMFGIGSSFSFWPGFAAHVVDEDRAFLSETALPQLSRHPCRSTARTCTG